MSVKLIRPIVWQEIDSAPKDSMPIWLYGDEWVDEDFNPSGIMDGYWDEHYDDLGGTWVVAGWDDCGDCYRSYAAAAPTHWAHKVPPPGI